MPPWADLPPELVCRIGEGLEELKCYGSARGACTAWRRALAPPSPSLLLVPDDDSRCVSLPTPSAASVWVWLPNPSAASLPLVPDDASGCVWLPTPSAASLPLVPEDASRCVPPAASPATPSGFSRPTRRLSAASLPTRRCFELKPIPLGARCVGSGHGWLALSVCRHSTFFSLFNPVTAAEIALPPLIYKGVWASKSKLVFAAAAICDGDRLAYVTAGARRWAILDPVPLASGDQLADAVYHEEDGKCSVYCLTRFGDVHVLSLPERRRRKAHQDITVDDITTAIQQRHYMMIRRRLLTPGEDQQNGMIRRRLFSAAAQRRFPQQKRQDMIRRKSVGPDLNAPATVEPLLSLPFDTATSFAPPCNKLSAFTSAKNLVFCEGKLYQVWRNASCTVTVRLPGGGHRRVAENEVLVLRYYPHRQPFWDVVPDLGGHSVFIGRNNAVSMYAQGNVVPGLKGDCVYWIGGRGRDQGMVFEMATGRTTTCLLPAASGFALHTTFCWYVLDCNNNGSKIVYQTRARVRADGEKQQDVEE